MPRAARKKSANGYYHVMMRTVNRELLFKDEEDYDQFRSAFNASREKYKIKMLAWCLMPNHVHLLIKDPEDNLSAFFRIFSSNFVYWYNRKYGRVGHLFQDRFLSEPIEDISYLLKAVRYIHMNPVKANICGKPEEYRYSSYSYYFSSGRYKEDDLFFKTITLGEFRKFHQENNGDGFLDIPG